MSCLLQKDQWQVVQILSPLLQIDHDPKQDDLPTLTTSSDPGPSMHINTYIPF